jgi:hypothetical protein
LEKAINEWGFSSAITITTQNQTGEHIPVQVAIRLKTWFKDNILERTLQTNQRSVGMNKMMIFLKF